MSYFLVKQLPPNHLLKLYNLESALPLHNDSLTILFIPDLL